MKQNQIKSWHLCHNPALKDIWWNRPKIHPPQSSPCALSNLLIFSSLVMCVTPADRRSGLYLFFMVVFSAFGEPSSVRWSGEADTSDLGVINHRHTRWVPSLDPSWEHASLVGHIFQKHTRWLVKGFGWELSLEVHAGSERHKRRSRNTSQTPLGNTLICLFYYKWIFPGHMWRTSDLSGRPGCSGHWWPWRRVWTSLHPSLCSCPPKPPHPSSPENHLQEQTESSAPLRSQGKLKWSMNGKPT